MTTKTPLKQTLAITPLNLKHGIFEVRGTAPYVQHKFSRKARQKMLDDQMKTAGSRGKKREPRNPEEEFEGAIHRDAEGRCGIPAGGIRSALIDACRMAGFVMTKARMSIFVDADTFDVDDATPLVYIEGTPEVQENAVRLESGVASIAIRPVWHQWSAKIRLSWDGDQFSITDVANLIARAGVQVGFGEGRPFSKKSNGMGWGTFELVK